MRRFRQIENFIDWIDPLHEVATEKARLNDSGEDESFLTVYPDAQLVSTHRDPADLLSSYTNMNTASRKMTVRPETINRDDLFREPLEVWAAETEHAVEVRRAHSEEQYFDLHFAVFIADPVGRMREIYRHSGIDWTSEGEGSFHAWSDANPPNKHGAHKHDAKALPLRREQIHERFAK